MQTVHAFEPHDVETLHIPAEEATLLDHIRSDHATPFQLETEPGWRVCIYRVSEAEHILSIVMHHIISDGWSVDVLHRELAELYSLGIGGYDLSERSPLPIQYTDYSAWQKTSQSLHHERQLELWVERLGSSRPAEVLCDKPRPETLSGEAKVEEFRIQGKLYQDMREVCSRYNVTPHILLLTVFRATQYRLTGATDATIGTPNANRDRWEVKDMIGFFVNMQCIRTTVEEDTFEELLRQVEDVCVVSFSNQDVPFERLVSALQQERELSRNPLVQITFAYHAQQSITNISLDGLDVEVFGTTVTSRFDIEFHCFQNEDSIRGQCIYSTDLYEPETIESLISVFKVMLARGIDNPTIAVADIDLMTEDSLSRLHTVGLASHEVSDYGRQLSVVDVWKKQAKLCPDRTAVRDVSGEFTYSQLDTKSDVVAHWLKIKSLPAETLVSVLAGRSCTAIIVFLGILKAGLAYLPFDTKTPVGRVNAVLETLPGRKLVLIQGGIDMPQISCEDVEIVPISRIMENEATDHASTEKVSATSLAYVMFTSGSTGKPKGVMIEHQNILRLAKENNVVRNLPAACKTAHISSLAFDASTWEIYSTLLNGGTLICIDSMAVLDYMELSALFAKELPQALSHPAYYGNICSIYRVS